MVYKQSLQQLRRNLLYKIFWYVSIGKLHEFIWDIRCLSRVYGT